MSKSKAVKEEEKRQGKASAKSNTSVKSVKSKKESVSKSDIKNSTKKNKVNIKDDANDTRMTPAKIMQNESLK